MGSRKTCPNSGCNNLTDIGAKQCLACSRKSRRRTAPPNASTPMEQLQQAVAESKQATELKLLREHYREAIRTIKDQSDALEGQRRLSAGISTHTIKPLLAGADKREATSVVVLSDWHIEENVGTEVGGLNTFDLTIAKERAARSFQKALRLTNLLGQDIRIRTMVVALLGDFITGNIHGEENAEVNETTPTEAIVLAQNWLASGIQFLLDNSKYSLVLPCHSGNHARTTKTTHFARENGHSLEFLMYHHLAAYFRNESRVTFVIPDGPHSYVKVYDETIRFQHGHMVKYGGGVGGIYIPVHKAIAQWNQAKAATLDVFGHFHQSRDGGNFICNGSLIGYNSFALSIKASYERPKQTLFLLDSKYGRTFTCPILL